MALHVPTALTWRCRLLTTLPEPRCGAVDVLHESRPLLAVVPGQRLSAVQLGAADAGVHQQQEQPAEREQGQHSVRLYSLRSHGFVRALAFHHPVLGMQASERLLVVALPGQIQAFDCSSLQHTLTCLTYAPPLAQRPSFITQAGRLQPVAATALQAGEAPPVPFALGPRWLAYASDQACSEISLAVAQRVPLGSSSAARRRGSTPAAQQSAGVHGSGAPAPGSSGLTAAAVSEAALQAAQRGGQQLRAGLTAVGSASIKYISHLHHQWRGQGQQGSAEAEEVGHLLALCVWGPGCHAHVLLLVVLPQVEQRQIC